MIPDLLTPRARLLLILGLIQQGGTALQPEWILQGSTESLWVEYWPDVGAGESWSLHAAEGCGSDRELWTQWDFDTEHAALNAMAARL